MEKNQPDIIMMKDGKVMLIRNGEEKSMEMVMNLSNGGKVTLDGTVTMPDGTVRRLMDGEAITLDGEPTTAVDQGARDKVDD